MPLLGFIAGTRVALGVGIGLLASKRLSRARRLRLGASLVAFGALTTIPAAIGLFRLRRAGEQQAGSSLTAA
jgi:hypothetical protein